MKTISIYILILLTWTSCVSEKELLTKIDFKNIKSNVEINNDFLNKNLNNYTYQNLIQLLNYQHNSKKFFNKYENYSDSLCVNIVFDGINKLNISYKDTNKNLVNYSLKVKNKGNYLSLKRKFKLIPIPFLFTYYWNEKTILYIDSENCLNFISGQNQFVWMILGAGGESIYENKFIPEKK